METTKKFDGRASDYAHSRPQYAAALLDHLYDNEILSPASTVADIGSGTGKFSRQLLDRQSEVYCVEPNADMRSVAEATLCGYPRFHSIAGEATHTTLASGSVDCITSAQAFHWFAGEPFKQECLRILKPGGLAILIWNVRDLADERNRNWHDIFAHHCPTFRGFSNGIERDDAKIRAFFGGRYTRVAFDHPLLLDKVGFIKRSLSSSYSLRETDPDFPAYRAALEALYDRYENHGQITIANRSVAYIGSVQ